MDGASLNGLILLVIVGTSLWVFLDARAIGVKKGQVTGLLNLGPLEWFLCCLLLWIVAFPAYLVNRDKLKGGGALMNCRDCGKSISRRAGSCPHCGAPNGA